MSMPWPEDLGSGTVLWDLGFMKADNDDPDRSPQLTAGTGITVNFSPDVSQAVRYNGVDGNKTIMPLLSQGIINEEGLLCTMKEDGTPDVVGVVLPATDSETMTPRDWTYTVTVLDNRIIINRFSISLATGAEIDLADFAPVDSSGGTHIVTERETALRAERAAGQAETFRNETRTDRQAAQTARTGAETARDQAGTHATASAASASSAADILAATEALGFTVDTSVGERIFIGDTMIYGDTGWRKIISLDETYATGEVSIRRTNNLVEVILEDFRWIEASPGINVMPSGGVPLGRGFSAISLNSRPLLGISDVDMYFFDNLIPYVAGYSNAFYLRWVSRMGKHDFIQGPITTSENRLLSGSITWTTQQDWPVELPGVQR